MMSSLFRKLKHLFTENRMEAYDYELLSFSIFGERRDETKIGTLYVTFALLEWLKRRILLYLGDMFPWS